MKSEPLTPETLTGCRITINNDVTGERFVKHSPQTAKESLVNDSDVEKAHVFIDCADMAECRGDKPEPIACSLRYSKADNVIEIHWYAVGDPTEALDRMRDILAKDWRCWR